MMRTTHLVPLQATRPSLFDLWTTYRFNSAHLTMQARVQAGTVQAMLGNQPVPKEDAEKVLATLSTLYHQEYSLETVDIPIIEGGTDGKQK